MRIILLCALGLTACSGTKRNETLYRQDTRAVLDTRRDQIASCYDRALATAPRSAGMVTVKFVVEKKTGVFKSATVDPAKSNATEPLVVCVLAAVRGLALDPPDSNEGQATFVYDFQPA
ncbi:MAG TPA: AgmX/PglI C-terminal domain-containing protein, partial [Kofleriaceae bacterium]